MSGDHTKYHGTAEVPKREWVGLTDEQTIWMLKDQLRLATEALEEAVYLLVVEDEDIEKMTGRGRVWNTFMRLKEKNT